MKLKVIFLGTGGALGVPRIMCSCNICKSAHQKTKNIRNNASIIIKDHKKTFLVDMPPEIRSMLSRQKVHNLDAVFLTHTHYDHIMGLNVLHLYEKQKTKMQLFMPLFAEQKLKTEFEKLFAVKHIEPKTVAEKFLIDETSVTPIQLDHGLKPCQGYVFESKNKRIAYLVDFNKIYEKELHKLKNLDLLIIESNFHKLKSTEHITIDEAIEIVKKLKPKQTVLTHLSHDIDYYELQNLPENISLAYDGMELEL